VIDDRHADERLALRAPRLARRLLALVLALPAGSAPRRRVLKRVMARGWAALSRGDDELVLLAFDRDVEFNIIGGEAALLGIDEQYRGREGWVEFIARWRAEWTGATITHTPEEVIDLGDRVVTRLTLSARGVASGADVAQTMGIVMWFRNGAIVRQDNYYDWAECASAIGLPTTRASSTSASSSR
jgi:ketosteroid isomerase-like protein